MNGDSRLRGIPDGSVARPREQPGGLGRTTSGDCSELEVPGFPVKRLEGPLAE